MYRVLSGLCIVALLGCWTTTSHAKTFKVDNADAIRKAITKAGPGDVIEVKPGEYDLGGYISTKKNGTKDKPITLRAAGDKGYAVLMTNGMIAFKISKKFWNFRGIHFKGDLKKTRATLFVDGPAGASDILITDCKISHSGQHGMKGGRTRDKAVDNIVIEHTELFQTVATGFDIVAGDNWVLRNNYVHDYGMGKGITYGIFLKGGGRNGIIEGCLVDGSGKPKSITVGISFGGGKTGKKWLPLTPNGKIAAEHDGGIARNNIVIGTRDIAYHTNNGANSRFYNNLAWKCNTAHKNKAFQRQASYPKDPLLVNNLFGGKLSNVLKDSRDNPAPSGEWFVDPDTYDFRLTDKGKAALVGKGTAIEENPTDLFGTARDMKQPVLGPILPNASQPTAWIDRRK